MQDPVSSAPPPACEPDTCDSLYRECGVASDGCGGALSCGTCGDGERCTSWGTCVAESSPPPACVPHSCQSLGRECGSASDGCGGTLSCGGCQSGFSCNSGACVQVSSCEPDTCDSLYRECGVVSDGCGATLSCGSCGSGESCTSWGSCVAVAAPNPAPPTCTPSTCQSLGRECGSASDGCGGTLNCGGCGSGELCSSGVCIAEPTPPPRPGGGGPDPKGRGPTGQWPPGFPAYASAPEIVTDGTSADLDSALNDPKCADGCLIEHPGNITTVGSAMNSRVGGSNDEIVIRPPIGQRSDYTVATGYNGSSANGLNLPGVLIAGYQAATSLFVVEGAVNTDSHGPKSS